MMPKFVFTPDLENAKELEKLFKQKRLVFSMKMLGCPSLPSPSPALFQGISEDDDDYSQNMVDFSSLNIQLHKKRLRKWSLVSSVSLVNK